MTQRIGSPEPGHRERPAAVPRGAVLGRTPQVGVARRLKPAVGRAWRLAALALAVCTACLAGGTLERVSAEVRIDSRDQLMGLVRMNVTIESVRGGKAYIQATAADLAVLRGQGLVVTLRPATVVPPVSRAVGPLGTYHDYAGLSEWLATTAQQHPAITRLRTLGTSVQGNDLWAIEVTDNPDVDEDEPEVLWAAAMHGDERVGPELCLYLLDWLTSRYGTDPAVTALVDGGETWIVPCLNPDGMEAGRRYNHNGVDLNRNYPVPDGSIGQDGQWAEEQETQVFMAFCRSRRFVVGANLHGGALVTNYPWDYTSARAPDDALVEAISRGYASRNPPMAASTEFEGGVVRGWVWYPVYGSLQDWHYQELGCLHLTIEVGDDKVPAASLLPAFWEDNREAMLHVTVRAGDGVRGVVTDAVNGQPVSAAVRVQGVDRVVWTDPDAGDYHRPLRPGTYAVQMEAAGYATSVHTGVIVPSTGSIRLDASMEPLRVAVEAAGSDVAEGGTLVLGVRLSAQPSAGVTVTVLAGEGDIDLGIESGAGPLVFTTTTWATAQAVTVRAAEDADAEAGSRTFGFEAPGWAPAEVVLQEVDDDVRLTVQAGAGGHVEPSGTQVIERTALPVTVVATADAGFTFLRWECTGGTVDLPFAATARVQAPGIAASATVQAVFATDVDSDGDGLPDTWEVLHFGNLSPTGDADSDGDGLSDRQEWEAGSDPRSYQLVLTAGWNLVSLARLPPDSSVQAVLGGRILGPAWVWTGQRYEVTDRLLPLRGHWVFCPAAATVDVDLSVAR